MDPYAVLGLAPGASLDEARRAYLVRLQLVHPDRHHGEAAAVLAEAERATRELNAAWDAVQSLLAGPPRPPGAPPTDARAAGPPPGRPPGAGPPRPPGPPPAAPPAGAPPAEPAACLQWAIDRLTHAGMRTGDPLSASEVELLRRPRAAAPGSWRFRRWVRRRRATLAAAVAADGSEAWGVVVRVLSDDGPSVVLGLLFSS